MCVTPLMAMAAELHCTGAGFTLHYCAHDRATAPFLAELEQEPFGHRVEVHLAAGGSGTGEQARRFDAGLVLAEAQGAHVHVCGPARLQDGVGAAAAALGWDAARVHRKRFTADVDREGLPFTVLAARSGVTAEVPPGRSIAQVLAERGVVIPISCEQGVCGTCVTRVRRASSTAATCS